MLNKCESDLVFVLRKWRSDNWAVINSEVSNQLLARSLECTAKMNPFVVEALHRYRKGKKLPDDFMEWLVHNKILERMATNETSSAERLP